MAAPPFSKITIENTADNPVPVVAKLPVTNSAFLVFLLDGSNQWESEEYVVPDGMRLKISFVAASISGNSGASRSVNSAVHMAVNFANGQGGICNRPTDADTQCRGSIPLLPLNNSDTGANMGDYFPSAMGPVPIEVPPGASIRLKLFSKIAAPEPGAYIAVNVVGVLVEE